MAIYDEKIMRYKSDEMLAYYRDLLSKIFTLLSEEDFEELRNYESDRLCEEQKLENDNLKKQGLKRVIKKITCYSPTTVDTDVSEDGTVSVVFVSRVFCERYLLDKDSGEVKDGILDYITENEYAVTLVENKKFGKIIRECEHCGADVDRDAKRCEYCGETIVRKTGRFIITDLLKLKTKGELKEYYSKKSYNDKKEFLESLETSTKKNGNTLLYHLFR